MASISLAFRAKSVCVEKNLGSGGRHGNNEQGEDQDVANNGESISVSACVHNFNAGGGCA